MSKYLDLELENQDFNTPEENILSRDERIISTIHIINTLKSVNDTALSDWRGVIGDFIDEKRDSILEQQEDREEALKDILDRIEILHESQKGQNIGQGLMQRHIKEKVELLQKELKVLATTLVGSPIKIAKSQRPSKSQFEKPCPSCGQVLAYRHKKSKGKDKYIKCPHCQEKLLSSIDDNSTNSLGLNRLVEESVNCPICSEVAKVFVYLGQGFQNYTRCQHCDGEFNVVRSRKGVVCNVEDFKGKVSQKPLDEGFIKKVKEKLPAQPWPEGTHKKVDQELKVSNRIVQRAMWELIKKGEFKVQINGKTYIQE